MLAAVLTFFAGAKRWFNPEMAKAAAAVAVVLILTLAGALLYGSGQSAGGARTDASWLNRFNAWNLMQAKRRERMAQQALQVEAESRAKAEAAEAEAEKRAALLAAELVRMQTLGQDRPIMSEAERMRLFRQ